MAEQNPNVSVVFSRKKNDNFWKFFIVHTIQQNRTSANEEGGGSIFWSFCNNVIIECPQSKNQEMEKDKVQLKPTDIC